MEILDPRNIDCFLQVCSRGTKVTQIGLRVQNHLLYNSQSEKGKYLVNITRLTILYLLGKQFYAINSSVFDLDKHQCSSDHKSKFYRDIRRPQKQGYKTTSKTIKNGRTPQKK